MKQKKSYAELLKMPKWQKKRLEIFNRDNWTCQECGDTKSTLHVHHLKYVKGKKPWEYAKKDLITLCEKCHEAKHEERKFIKFMEDGIEKTLNDNNLIDAYNLEKIHEIYRFIWNFILDILDSENSLIDLSKSGGEVINYIFKYFLKMELVKKDK